MSNSVKFEKLDNQPIFVNLFSVMSNMNLPMDNINLENREELMIGRLQKR